MSATNGHWKIPHSVKNATSLHTLKK